MQLDKYIPHLVEFTVEVRNNVRKKGKMFMRLRELWKKIFIFCVIYKLYIVWTLQCIFTFTKEKWTDKRQTTLEEQE